MRASHGLLAFVSSLLLVGPPTGAAPLRVVSTHLCADEYVFRLVPREHIEALSYLAGDTHPVVSTIANQVRGIALIRGSAEEVLMLSPDLVVLYAGANPRLKAQLIEAHTPFIEIPWSTTLADVRTETLKLGAQLGASGRARALVEAMDRDLATAREHAASHVVRTLVYEPNGYATTGGLTDEIMAQAGLDDVATKMGATRSGTIPVEMVAAEPPELLIVDGGREGRSQADLVLQHPGLAALKGKIAVVHAMLTPLLCPGPWSAGISPMLAQWGRAVRVQQKWRPDGS